MKDNKDKDKSIPGDSNADEESKNKVSNIDINSNDFVDEYEVIMLHERIEAMWCQNVLNLERLEEFTQKEER